MGLSERPVKSAMQGTLVLTDCLPGAAHFTEQSYFIFFRTVGQTDRQIRTVLLERESLSGHREVRTMDDESIFERAVRLSLPEREAFSAEACGDDQQLRRHIDRLVAAHESPNSFLPLEPAILPTVDRSEATESVDTVIGPYKLREQIGEGGMGVVFVADQEHPVRRRVALKIINAERRQQES